MMNGRATQLRGTWFAMLTMGLMSVTSCGGTNEDCEAWMGTWRGTFKGTVEGRSFELGFVDFQLEVRPGFEDGMVKFDNETWLLSGGYAVKFSGQGQHACEGDVLSLDEVFCFIESPDGESDNCDFSGSLNRATGTISGTWAAPGKDDRSPTVNGEGTWTLSR